MKWKHYQEGGEVAPVPANTWAPEWSRVPPPEYTATPAAVPTDPSARFPAGGAANPAIMAYLGGTNPATISYDPAVQERLRGHRMGLRDVGVATVGAEADIARGNVNTDLLQYANQSYSGVDPYDWEGDNNFLSQPEIKSNSAIVDKVLADAGVPIEGGYNPTTHVFTPEQQAAISGNTAATTALDNIYMNAQAVNPGGLTSLTTGQVTTPGTIQGFGADVGQFLGKSPLISGITKAVAPDSHDYYTKEVFGGNTQAQVDAYADAAAKEAGSVKKEDGTYDISSWFDPTPAPVSTVTTGGGNSGSSGDSGPSISDNDRGGFFSGPGTGSIDTSTGATNRAWGGRNDGGYIEGYNTGGMDSWWENDPLANLAKTEVGDGSTVAKELGQAFAGGLAAPQQGQSPLASVKGKAMELGTNALFGALGFNRGGWVAARAKHLNVGGMAAEQAGMQAYQDMMSLAGPGGSPESMMPEGAPAPEGFAIDHGYKPPGMSTKEQMEVDKMMAQRDAYAGDQMRKEKSFDKAEARKDDMHRMAMQQKQEGHQESMKQKRSGPLG